MYEFFTTFTKKNVPLKNNLTFLGMENDLAAKNNGGYWTFYESFSQQVGKIGRQSRLFISVYSIFQQETDFLAMHFEK